MSEAHAITMPTGGWTVDDLDRWPETHVRYELTDGALGVTPSPSSLHQAYAQHGIPHYWRAVPEPLRVRFHRLGHSDSYREVGGDPERLTTEEPFEVDVPLTDLLPRWAH